MLRYVRCSVSVVALCAFAGLVSCTSTTQQAKPAVNQVGLPSVASLDGRVATGTSSTTLLAANGARVFASVMNDSGSTVLVAFGSTATTTDYTVKLVDGAYFEVPTAFQGLVTAVVAAGSATVRVTEVA